MGISLAAAGATRQTATLGPVLSRTRVAVVAVVVLALVLVAGAVVGGTDVWHRLHRSPLDDALHRVPASSLRVGFTDWAVVRATLHSHIGTDPPASQLTSLMSKAYDGDFSPASSIADSAVALQKYYGFSPANAQWEAYAQGRKGATMVLKVAKGADFDVLADNLGTAGYTKPAKDDGVWKGGVDLVAKLDPTLTPELQYVVLLKKQGLVVSSDEESYAASAAAVASGDGDNLASTGRVDGLDDSLGHAANAMVWSGDFACQDLAMSQADNESQDEADALVKKAGGVTPVSGLAMSMLANRTLRVAEHFENGGEARQNLRPRARLAVGSAVGRGGNFSDDFKLTRSRTSGSTVLLDLVPREKTGYVLSALYDGPVLFATC
jgi:hypothetical protein